MMKVYLAGPISGLSYGGCTSWRDFAIKRLAAAHIRGVSPMRCKEYLSHLKEMDTDPTSHELYASNPLSTNRGINARDHYDTKNCDLVLANLVDATRVSIGTMIELGWAQAYRRPIIGIMGKDGKNPHHHGMVTESFDFWYDNLPDALDCVVAVLQAHT